MTKSPHAHVRIAEEAVTPEHTYIERLHTPRRHTASKEPSTEEEWAELKHAHIDEDAMSPSGLVDRVQTPLHQSGDVEAEIVQLALDEAEEATRSQQAVRTRMLLALLTHSISFAAGAGFAVALLKSRKSK